MFGSDKNNSDEIKKIWERVVALEELTAQQKDTISNQNSEISSLKEKVQTPSESQKIAQTASRSATTYRVNIAKIKEEINEILSDSLEKHKEIAIFHEQTQTLSEKVNISHSEIKSIEKQCKELQSELDRSHTELDNKIEQINTAINEGSNLDEDISLATTKVDQALEIESQASDILKNIANYHSKARSLNNEISGYEVENESGETERISGIKDQLEHAYSDTENKINKLETDVLNFQESIKERYSEIVSQTNQEIYDTLTNFEKQFDKVYQRIKKLLPDALTAGLSSAYEDKTNSESLELNTHKTTFTRAIIGLVAVSLIPFIADAYLFFGLNKDLITVISETPKILISILPLYFPILWIAYSSNKKVNLSKRLIEEYTHKGVLSKTYEGLSTQIEELENSDLSAELRVKLLFNLLHVNSENPGKLISNYDTSDHPLMDALDKSSQLANSIDKLSNIPGLSALTKKLEAKRQKLLKEADEKIAEVITEDIIDEVTSS